jgi:AraC family transcriptional regulator
MEGGEIMDYRIEKKPSFMLMGKVKEFSADMEISRKEIPMFWSECYKDGTSEKLVSIAGHANDLVTGKGLLGWCSTKNCPKEKEMFEYAIAVETKDEVSQEFTKIMIPAYTWAVFKCVGVMPLAIQNMWNRIYSEFLPQSEYRMIEDMDFEFYPEGDGSKKDYISEIWIPVEKK